MTDVDRTSDEWVGLNTRFHETISGACQWPHLVDLIRVERNRVRRYMSIALRLAGRDPHEEHSQILSACERREADLASMLVSKHILRTSQYVIEYVRGQCRSEPSKPVAGPLGEARLAIAGPPASSDSAS
jgi:DNA-binding GntR family transcriptional regulator